MTDIRLSRSFMNRDYLISKTVFRNAMREYGMTYSELKRALNERMFYVRYKKIYFC